MSDLELYLKKYSSSFVEKLNSLDLESSKNFVDLLTSAKHRNDRILFFGNGGSAAIASHCAVDYSKVGGFIGTSFHDSALITCFSNDYGYDHWIAECISRYASPNDIVVLISSSGKSPNILNGAIEARNRSCKLVTFSGFDDDNQLRGLGDVNFWVNSSLYNVVENVHQCWLLSILDCVSGVEIE